jgi:hypothetical protein
MSYLTQDAIASNVAMQHRVAQCAAQEGVGIGGDPATGMGKDPDRWTLEKRRYWSAAPGWDEAWEYAKNTHPDDGDEATPPYDPGADSTVITDAQILAQVQSMVGTA